MESGFRWRNRMYADLHIIKNEYSKYEVAIRQRLQEFASVPSDEYFYELIYCLLTPQSSAVNASKTVEKLRKEQFQRKDFSPAPILRNKLHYIRFHNTKAKHLTEAKSIFAEIAAMLANGHTNEEQRSWLVANVKGLGWKEASHFLRNIGRRDMAILDRHILKNLKLHRVIKSIPETLTPKRYRNIERRFRRFGDSIGIPMDDLDLLFWARETGHILK